MMRIIMILLSVSLSLSAMSQDSITEPSSVVVDMIDMARSFIGVKHKMGGTSAKGFDCSGLLYFCGGQMGIELPRASYAQAGEGDYVEADSLQAGDFIFFNGYNIASRKIGHVAMVTEVQDGDIYIIHATSSRGVMEEVLQENAYFMKRWVYNKRIIDEK